MDMGLNDPGTQWVGAHSSIPALSPDWEDGEGHSQGHFDGKEQGLSQGTTGQSGFAEGEDRSQDPWDKKGGFYQEAPARPSRGDAF